LEYLRGVKGYVGVKDVFDYLLFLLGDEGEVASE
jgi:hypothetical protein